MKTNITTLLPALALLTLGGCAGTSSITTTEPDGVYYSSQDRTGEVVTASAGSGQDQVIDDPDAVANPEYQDGQSRRGGSDEYYDEDYSYSARIRRFHQPYYRGLGMGYFDYAYTDPFWYDPFYSPFGYDPFWGPGWGGSFVSINIGWGWGSYGRWNPYYGYGYGYRPYGYGGYHRGFYDGFYSGRYGRGWGGYGSGYWDGYRQGGRVVNYAPRRDRSVEALSSNSGGRTRTTEVTGGRNTDAANNPVRSRLRMDEPAPNTGGVTTVPGGKTVRTGRTDVATPAPDVSSQPATGRSGKLYRVLDTTSPTNPDNTGGVRPAPNTSTTQPGVEYGGSRRRDRTSDYTPQPAQPQQPQYSQPRPRRDRSVNTAPQPAQERPVRRERSYEPAPTRSYEAPTRTYDSGGSRGTMGGGNSGGRRGRGE